MKPSTQLLIESFRVHREIVPRADVGNRRLAACLIQMEIQKYGRAYERKRQISLLNFRRHLATA